MMTMEGMDVMIVIAKGRIAVMMMIMPREGGGRESRTTKGFSDNVFS